MAGWRRAALAVVLVVGACGDDGGDGDGAESSTATPGGPARVLRLGIAPVDSLDPATASPDSPSASIVADLLYDGLPALSEEVESAEGDRRWTFTLDDDLRFGDGDPITAADVVASLERVRDAGPSSLPGSRLDVVTAVSAVDPRTVVVELARPMETLPALLDAPAYGVVPAGGPYDGSVGSGPYRLRDADAEQLSLVPAFGRRVAADAVEVRQFEDPSAAALAFEVGNLDWALVTPLTEDSAVDATPFQAEVFYGFNLADPLFDDVRFRQAIVQAIDRDAIVAEVFGRVAQPLPVIVPEGVMGADPSRCAAGCAYDPEAARLLLDEAFAGAEVHEVPIDFPDDEDEAAVAALVAEDLGAVGIPTVLRAHPADEYAAFAVSGEQGLASLGWIGVAPTADDYIDRLFRSDSPDNLTGFRDPEVDRLLDEGDVGAAEALILEAAAVALLAQFQVLTLQSDAVVGLRLEVDGTFDPTTATT